MKKILGIVLTIVCMFCLVACMEDSTRGYIENDNINHGDVEIIDIYYFEGEIEEINGDTIKVLVMENNGGVISSDSAIINTKDIVIDFTMQIGDIVGITFEGKSKGYPAQIDGTIGIDLIRSYASMFEYIEEDGRIKYNGVWYDKDKLSSETLDWLNMSSMDKTLSGYYPFEFVDGANLGVEVYVENTSNKGLVFVCKHSSDKELTSVYELQTGSYYSLEVLKDNEYITVEHSVENLAWTAEAWIISKDAETRWSLDWEWLYGRLPEGKYRVGKEIMNFKETGVYDTIMVYGYFEVK